MSTELAVGHVRLEADTTTLARSLEQAMGPIGTQAGQTAGQHFAAGLNTRLQQVSAPMTQTLQRAAQAAGTQAGNTAGDSMAAGITTRLRSGSTAQMSTALTQAGRAAGQAGGDAAGREMAQATASGLRNDSHRIAGALTQAGRQAGAEGGEAAGTGMAGGLMDKIKGLGGKAGPIAAALGAAASLAGVSAAGLFAKALGDGMQQQASLDLTQAKLGIDDATMARIGQAAGKAYGNNFGESVSANLDAARSAIQAGLLDPNASAADTQKVIEQLDTVSQVLGEEIPNVSRAAGQAIRTGLVKDGAGAMDLFVKAQQNGLNTSEDFLDTVTEYGTQFRKLGLDGPEAFALVSQAVKGGARDTDVAADALKEFSIRAIDGSKSSATAYEQLGLSAQDMTEKIARGGPEAKAGLQQVLQGISAVKDPALQSQIAVGLFGTQAEDLGAALGKMNLNTAAQEFGNVAGAANNAANTIGDNAASKIETAKRSIETASSQIGLALANAFGPQLGKVADWVTTHQPEIIGFFKSMADGAFTTADAVAAFASGSLRVFANMAEGIGGALGPVLDQLGGFSSIVGDILSVIPGMGDEADLLKDAGAAMSAFNDRTGEAATKARELADGIDNKVRPGLDNLRQGFDESAGAAVEAAKQSRAFGGDITALPDGKSVKVNAITAEAQALVDQFGLKVEHLPDGTSIIHADTAAGEAELTRWLTTQRQMNVAVIYRDANGNSITPDQLVAPQQSSFPTDGSGRRLPGRARGGIFHGVGGPTDDANVVAISNKEHLAFITRAQAANPATIPFLDAINNGWVPPAGLLHNMIPGFAGGGLVTADETARMGGGTVNASLWAAIKSNVPDAVLTSAETDHENDGGFHPQGKAIDIAPNPAALSYLWGIRDQLGQIIVDDETHPWYNVNGEHAEGAAARAIYGEATMAQHGNHIHAMALGAISGAANPNGNVPAAVTEQDRVADTIIAEGRKRGISDKGIKIALAAGLAESGLRNLPGGDRDSTGVFQQRDNGAWGTAADRMDPAKSAGMFYDQLAKLDYEKMDPGAAAQAIQKSGDSSGGNYTAQIPKAEDIFAQRGQNINISSDGSQQGAGGVQQVYVVNFPGGPQSAKDANGNPTAGQSPNVTPTSPAGPTLSSFGDRAAQAGQGFVQANVDQFVGDLGLPAGGGKYLQSVVGEVSKLASWRPPVEINNHITVSDDKSQIRELERRNALALMQYGGGA